MVVATLCVHLAIAIQAHVTGANGLFTRALIGGAEKQLTVLRLYIQVIRRLDTQVIEVLRLILSAVIEHLRCIGRELGVVRHDQSGGVVRTGVAIVAPQLNTGDIAFGTQVNGHIRRLVLAVLTENSVMGSIDRAVHRIAQRGAGIGRVASSAHEGSGNVLALGKVLELGLGNLGLLRQQLVVAIGQLGERIDLSVALGGLGSGNQLIHANGGPAFGRHGTLDTLSAGNEARQRRANNLVVTKSTVIHDNIGDLLGSSLVDLNSVLSDRVIDVLLVERRASDLAIDVQLHHAVVLAGHGDGGQVGNHSVGDGGSTVHGEDGLALAVDGDAPLAALRQDGLTGNRVHHSHLGGEAIGALNACSLAGDGGALGLGDDSDNATGVAGAGDGALELVAGSVGASDSLDLDLNVVAVRSGQRDIEGLEVGVGLDGVVGQLDLLAVHEHLKLGTGHMLRSLNAQGGVVLGVELGQGGGGGVTILGEVPDLDLAGLEGHLDGLTMLHGLGSLGGSLVSLSVDMVEHDVIGTVGLATNAGIELEADLLGSGGRVAHGDDALVAGVIETSETVSILLARRTRGAACQRCCGGGVATDPLGVAQHIEVLFLPLEEVCVDEVLLVVEDRVGVVELPERGTTSAHHVQVVAELLTVHGVGGDTRTLLTEDRVVVVDVGHRELEVVILHEVIVRAVTIGEHGVHLVVDHAIGALAAVGSALHPHGVGPLQEPRRRVHVAGKGDPELVDLLLISGLPDLVEQVNPLLPQIGGMIIAVGATEHVLMVLIVTNHTVARIESAVLAAIGKTVPLPVVNAVILHPFDGHVLELGHVALVGDIDGTAGSGAISGIGDDAGQVALVVVAATRANPHTKVRAELLNKVGRRGQAIGELVVELPESLVVQAVLAVNGAVAAKIVARQILIGALAVLVPAVVHNVRLDRTDTRLVEMLINRKERLNDVLIIDEHHVVEPGVVLDAEVRRLGNLVDVIKEVRLDNVHIRTVRVRGAAHGLPRNVLAILGQLIITLEVVKVLAGPIAGAADLGIAVARDDLGVRLGELGTEEHALSIERLAKDGLLHIHGNHAALVGRDGPGLLGVLDVQVLTVDVVEALGLVGRLDLQPLAHIVIAVVHGDLLRDGHRRGTELLGLEVESHELAGLGLVVQSHVRVFDNRLALELKIRRLQDGALGIDAGDRGELLGHQVKLGRGGKAALALSHLDADKLLGALFLKTEVHPLCLTVLPYLVITSAEHTGALGVLKLVFGFEEPRFGIGGINLELLPATVGVGLRTRKISDGLELALGGPAVDGHLVGGLRITGALAVIRMPVGTRIAIDQGSCATRIATLGGAGVDFGGPSGGVSRSTIDNALAGLIHHVDLSDVCRLVLLGGVVMEGFQRNQANLRRSLGSIQVKRLLALLLAVIQGKLLNRLPGISLGNLNLHLQDSARAVILSSIVKTRSVLDPLEGLLRVEIEFEPGLHAIGLLSGRPVGIGIPVERGAGLSLLIRVVVDGRNSRSKNLGLNARKGLLGLDTLRLDETLDIKLLGTIRGIQRSLAELILNLPGFETPPLHVKRTRDGVVANGDGVIFLRHYDLAVPRIGDSWNGETKAGHEGRRDHRGCKQTLTHLHPLLLGEDQRGRAAHLNRVLDYKT